MWDSYPLKTTSEHQLPGLLALCLIQNLKQRTHRQASKDISKTSTQRQRDFEDHAHPAQLHTLDTQ
ncbi:hypothetical protein ABEB36_014261 [Hypothenemus hampei]|uniref:Uncharacterized protein n=1 Tax=Hypothenemus hampei TaxID=57062 RepID=A0ABD1E3U8_HYPHA